MVNKKRKGNIVKNLINYIIQGNVTASGLGKYSAYALKGFNATGVGNLTNQVLSKGITNIDPGELALSSIGGAIIAPAVVKVGDLTFDRLGNGNANDLISRKEVFSNDIKLLNEPMEPQDHHIIPAFRGKSKIYADFIRERNINVDDYTITISGGKGGQHMNYIHGKGQWNQKWINI